MLRRSLFKAAVAMPFGTQQSQGFNNSIVGQLQAGNTIINKNGMFGYSGTPAHGNLIYSETTIGPTTDNFSNSVPSAGVTVYINSGGVPQTALSLQGATVVWYTWGGAVWVQGPSIGWTPTIGLIIQQAVTNTFMEIDLPLKPLVAIQPGTTGTPETWHPMTLQNGWTNNVGFAPAQYQKVASPPNCVEIIGAIVGTAATSAQFATLGAGYIPTNPQGMAVGCTAAADSTNLRCDASGNLTIANVAIPVAQTFFFHGLISLNA